MCSLELAWLRYLLENWSLSHSLKRLDYFRSILMPLYVQGLPSLPFKKADFFPQHGVNVLSIIDPCVHLIHVEEWICLSLI